MTSGESTKGRPDHGRRGRVLVVDDEPALLRTLERILTDRGYAVECASDGEEATGRLASESFDTVLSDIAMPGMSGIDLLRSVRERDLDVPVVLMTGEPAVATAIEAVELGVFHYLTKPLEVPALEEVLARAIKLHRTAKVERD